MDNGGIKMNEKHDQLNKYFNEFYSMKHLFLNEIEHEKHEIIRNITKQYLNDIFYYFEIIVNNCRTKNYDSLVPQTRSILEYCKKSIHFLNGDSEVYYYLMIKTYLNENRKMNLDIIKETNKILCNTQKNSKEKFLKNIKHLEDQVNLVDKKINENDVNICNKSSCKNILSPCSNNECKILKITNWIQYNPNTPSKKDPKNTITNISNEYFSSYYKLLSGVNHGTTIIEKVFWNKESLFDEELIFLTTDIIGSYFIQLTNSFPKIQQKKIQSWESNMRNQKKKLLNKIS